MLWRRGLLRFRDGVGWITLADFAILFLAMGAMKYGLHRVAHHPRLYVGMLRTHHVYESPGRSRSSS